MAGVGEAVIVEVVEVGVGTVVLPHVSPGARVRSISLPQVQYGVLCGLYATEHVAMGHANAVGFRVYEQSVIVLPPETVVLAREYTSLHRQTACPWHVLVADVILETRISIPTCVKREHHD